jgi:hypothetical protein
VKKDKKFEYKSKANLALSHTLCKVLSEDDENYCGYEVPSRSVEMMMRNHLSLCRQGARKIIHGGAG